MTGFASRRKYGNRITELDGFKFASAKESRRYATLKLLERAGHVTDLQVQPVFPIVINGQHVCKVIPDFAYVENGKRVVEDVKSEITRQDKVYRLKAKLMKAVHGIEVVEV